MVATLAGAGHQVVVTGRNEEALSNCVGEIERAGSEALAVPADCAEQELPGQSVLRTDGCCDPQMTRPLAATIGAERYELASPVVCALPVSVAADTPAIAFAVVARVSPAAAVGPPVFLITRALLI